MNQHLEIPRAMRYLVGSCLVIACLSSKVAGAAVIVTNLVTDDQAANPAATTDPNLVNAWGTSYAPTGPFWVSNNGTGTSTLYNVNPATNVPTTLGLVVSVPGGGSVTGQAYNNSSAAFNGDQFLFVNEDGTISGWRGALGTNAEILQTGLAANVYKGASQATVAGNAYLYSANFRAGTVDVLKGTALAPDLAGNFTDPNLPAGYAPFNIENLGGTLYVAYALQDSTQTDEVAGAGLGIVDAFDTNGVLLGRIASGGPLNAPWGMCIAPDGFAGVGGDLLVGNFGDGTINAFNLSTHAYDGPLTDASNQPISIDGLWSLRVGNDTAAGASGAVYFTAGPGDESHGLFGVLTSVPEPSTWTLAGSAAVLWAMVFASGRLRASIGASVCRR